MVPRTTIFERWRFQTYTDWELMTACQIRVLSNAYYDKLKSDYGIPKSTLKHHVEKICPQLQCINEQHVHQMLKGGEVPISKVLEIIKMYVQKLKLEDQLTLIQMKKHWWLHRNI